MKISYQLRKKYKEDNYGIIYIRNFNIKKNRFQYESTGISLPVKLWNNKKKEVRSSHPDNIKINNDLKDLLNVREKEVELNLPISNNNQSFLKYLKDHIDQLEIVKDLGNRKKYLTTYKHLLRFSDGDIQFSDMDIKWIKRVDHYLQVQGIGHNTRNNYLKCVQKLYREALLDKIYLTYDDPFKRYKFTNTKVSKDYLSISNLQNLEAAIVDRNSKLEEIRNRFLFQIYAQGIRVSDLFTIRYKNIFFDDVDSRIKLKMYKTKKDHTILLSYELIKHLFYYVDREEYHNMYFDRVYNITIDNKRRSGTLPIIEKYSLVKIKPFIDGVVNPVYEKFSDQIGSLYGRLARKQLKLIKSYANDHIDDFIIPQLNNNLFKDVTFNTNTKLDKKQVNHFDSKIAVYNRDLKKLQPLTQNTNINIVSHTARHSFANLLLSRGVDVYTISKSLGHSRLSVTESYIKGFDQVRIDDDIIDAFRIMRLSRIRSRN